MSDRLPGALFTDLYELAMLQAYFHGGMHEPTVFELSFRTFPGDRNYLLACGLDEALAYLEALAFTEDDLAYLATLDRFAPDFLEWLRTFRFTGAVRALPEGTPYFPGTPLLEVSAPLPEAQLVETALLNALHPQTLLASKAARVVHAAEARAVIDFGARRAHGVDGSLAAARALYIAGFESTSNVLAGRRYGIPVAGTMAHSYVQARGDDLEAFRAFVAEYPDTVLLVDTYDTVAGVQAVIALAEEHARRGEPFRVRALRIDSGDLAAEARGARTLLDAAGLQHVGLLASGGLDEYGVAALVAAGAPYDGFGVGTRIDVVADAPSGDAVYKLVAFAGRGSIKLSPGKQTLPGSKQVYRQFDAGGRPARDVVTTTEDASVPGEPLLVSVMEGGRRTAAGEDARSLEAARDRAARQLARLPARFLELTPADPPYEVAIAPALEAALERTIAALGPMAPRAVDRR